MPEIKLGESLEIALAAKDLQASLPFYKTLGFSQFGEVLQDPHPWVVLSDGTIHIGLHQYEAASPSLVYFTNQFQAVQEHLNTLGIEPAQQVEMDGQPIMVGFDDPNGQRITVADLMGVSIEPPQVDSPVKVGKFGEFSIPTADRDVSVAFYRQLGFEGKVYDQPYPWALLQDGMVTIGLHQTSDFKEATITYFSEQMVEQIEWVKAQGIRTTFTNTNAAGQVHEAGIRSPDGQPFFLFYEEGW